MIGLAPEINKIQACVLKGRCVQVYCIKSCVLFWIYRNVSNVIFQSHLKIFTSVLYEKEEKNNPLDCVVLNFKSLSKCWYLGPKFIYVCHTLK